MTRTKGGWFIFMTAVLVGCGEGVVAPEPEAPLREQSELQLQMSSWKDDLLKATTPAEAVDLMRRGRQLQQTFRSQQAQLDVQAVAYNPCDDLRRQSIYAGLKTLLTGFGMAALLYNGPNPAFYAAAGTFVVMFHEWMWLEDEYYTCYAGQTGGGRGW